jgi:hypothetical protein
MLVFEFLFLSFTVAGAAAARNPPASDRIEPCAHHLLSAKFPAQLLFGGTCPAIIQTDFTSRRRAAVFP